MGKYVTHLGGNSPVTLPGEQPSQSRTAPTDKFVLRWNNTLEIWEPSDTAPIAESALEADKVTGVDTAGNDKYYGTNPSGTPGFYDLPDVDTLNNIGDVNVPAPTDKYVLRWDNGTGMWVASDRALGVEGVDAASADQYYGKDEGGTIGFFDLPSGANGGGTDRIFFENDQLVTTDYTITNNKNAMSAGPITIDTGITVTVGAGETWTVV